MPTEVEVKFRIEDRPNVRERIIGLGARSEGRHFETNIRYEDPDRPLLNRNALLRLRRDRRARLTYKSPGREKDGQFKVRRELEVEVSDFDTMDRLLKALGFEQVQVYEKRRETLALDGTEFCLDTMPFGEFLEIEGAPGEIRRFARALGLPWGSRILTNYLSIFGRIRQALDLPFTDVTFDNFDGVGPLDLAPLLSDLQAGGG